MHAAPQGRRVRARAETHIAAPPDVVYRWATAPDRVVLWVKDLVESRSLDDGPMRVGARSIEVIQDGGKRLDVPAEVTALEPGRFVEIRMDSPGGPVTSRTDIAATATGSAVVQTMDAVFTGMRLIPSSILAILLTRRLDGDLRRLKKVVESG